MERLIKLLPLKYKRRVNKVLRMLGLVPAAKQRVRSKPSNKGVDSASAVTPNPTALS